MSKNNAAGEKGKGYTVLITGGNGSIGKPLTRQLLETGYIVHHLVRAGSVLTPGVESFTWDIYNRTIDPACITGVNAVIHLAGEPIAAKPWTNNRMRQIIESRTASIRMIYQLMRTCKQEIATVISASAVGYYGDREDEILHENAGPGKDFLANCCVEWEAAADEAPVDTRVVKLRTGIVLHKKDSALAPIAKAVRLGVGAPLGSGKQWMPWIHINDAVNLYCYALENENLKGSYNMAAPAPVTNKIFITTLANTLKKPLWLPPVPAIVLRLLLGKMSSVLLESTRVSADKIRDAGFTFSYTGLREALIAIYNV